MLSPEWSVAARYAHARNRATIFVRDDDGQIVASNDERAGPVHPRRTSLRSASPGSRRGAST
jgi:hypothetical protein